MRAHERRRRSDDEQVPASVTPRDVARPASSAPTLARSVAMADALGVQMKLRVGSVAAPEEREADRVADLVVRRLDAPSTDHGEVGADDAPAGSPATVRLLRRDADPSASSPVSREGGDVAEPLAKELRAASGGGGGLPDRTRERFEGAMGSSLGDVRVHTDSRAAELNDSLGARAFTLGNDVFFGRSEFRPGTTSGDHLIAHELAHTRQPAKDVSRSTIRRTEEERRETYDTVPANLEGSVKRTATPKHNFSDTMSDITRALSLPRDANGELSAQSMALMQTVQDTEWQNYLATSDAIQQTMVTDQPLDKKAIEQNDIQRNNATGKSRMPEYGNLAKLSDVPETPVTSAVRFGSTTFNVRHTTRDVNLKPRLAMVKAAVKKVEGAGFKLPATIELNLPKWGQGIDVASLCPGGDSTPRAVFVTPNRIHLSSAVVGNPIDSLLGDLFFNLSTELDPTGAGSVVHEMGHMLHFDQSPKTFAGLFGAADNGLEAEKTSASVSGYATKNPREFVAEVFLALVYGRTMSDEVVDHYAELGGPTSAKVTAQVAKAKAKGKQPTPRKPAKGKLL